MKQVKPRIKSWRDHFCYRKRTIVGSRDHQYIMINKKPYINYSSNDYLSIAQHPDIIAALNKATGEYGFGSGSSPQLSGYSLAHHELECELADWMQVDQVVLFNSGYLANLGVAQSLMKRGDIVYGDRLLHASMLDGQVLARANFKRYQNRSIESLLELCQKKMPQFVLTEGVFSMEGDIAPLDDLARMAQAHQINLIIDDAHGIGVLGNTGRGTCEHFGLNQRDYACMILPLGKAFAGQGGIVAGRLDVIEPVLQFARSYRYSTALPSFICEGLRAALRVLKHESWRRHRLHENICFFNRYACSVGLPIMTQDKTPIRSIMVGDNENVLNVQNKLLQAGFYVSCIRPPTVPQNTARIRVSINCDHTQEQLKLLIDNLVGFLS